MRQNTKDKRLRSMTGLSALEGACEHWTWRAEIRSVNGKGLDLRLRLPDWIDGLEQKARGLLGQSIKRGNINLTVRVTRIEGAGGLGLNREVLDSALGVLKEIEARAEAQGITLAPSRAADLAQLKGVLEQAGADENETAALGKAILADIETLVADMDNVRLQEGAALAEVLEKQLAEITRLTEEAAHQAEARKPKVAAALKANLAQIMEDAGGADPDRVAQELALLAVKADVTEEIDRLRAHVKAAHGLLGEGRAVGRKLDFLMQEFNREANTLCAKSQNADLTQTGLALKAVIDQLREQVQNVE